MARELGLKEGDKVDLCALDGGPVAVVSERQRREAIVARVRAMAVPLPADYAFDRDETNRR